MLCTIAMDYLYKVETFVFEAKKYIRLKYCQPFIPLLIFVLPVDCLVQKKTN